MDQLNRHPFRFGVVAARAASGAEWLSIARRIEALGYSTLLMPDRPGRVLAPLSALAAAATATTSLRVGTFVLANGLRNAAVLASECATLDFLSNGRFELGLGTGVSEEDFQRASIEYGRPGERIERLERRSGSSRPASRLRPPSRARLPRQRLPRNTIRQPSSSRDRRS